MPRTTGRSPRFCRRVPPLCGRFCRLLTRESGGGGKNGSSCACNLSNIRSLPRPLSICASEQSRLHGKSGVRGAGVPDSNRRNSMFMHEEGRSHLNLVLDPPAPAEGRIRRDNSRPWSRNLLHSFRELLDHLRDLAAASIDSNSERKIMLDAYLTTCALWQILEDFLHRGLLRVELRMKAAAREAANPVRSARSPRNWIQIIQKGIRSQAVLIPSRAADA